MEKGMIHLIYSKRQLNVSLTSAVKGIIHPDIDCSLMNYISKIFFVYAAFDTSFLRYTTTVRKTTYCNIQAASLNIKRVNCKKNVDTFFRTFITFIEKMKF